MIKGLIGKKLGHSFSKSIHESLSEGSFDLIELNEQQFHEFMTNKNFDAINITIPYKEMVFQYCDEISEQAQRIHAINTIKKVDNRLIATNTDYDGLKDMIVRHFDLQDSVVAICGSGGTSKTALAVCQDLNVKKILQVARNRDLPYISYEEMKKHDEIEYIINTTSVGMSPDLMNQIVDLNDFKNCKGVIDVIYNPLRTSLTLQAKQLNIPYVNGLEMLVGQAIKAIEFFYDRTLDESVCVKMARSIFRDKENLVFIGMPGCGKTTISNCLGELLNMNVVDLDEMIEKKANKSIPDIFKEDGEEVFRKIESEVVYEASLLNHTIISCGGGVVLKEENMRALQLNGFIVYLKRDLDQLEIKGRPLSENGQLQKLYETRKSLYEKYSDVCVENIKIETCCDEVMEVWHEHTCA